MLRIVHLVKYQSYLSLLSNPHIRFEIGRPCFLHVRVNRCMTVSTNLKLPCINFSLASLSPSFILINNSCFSLFDSTGSFAVFTPAISTFLIKLKTPFRNMLFTLFPKGVNFILIYNSRKKQIAFMSFTSFLNSFYRFLYNLKFIYIIIY